MAYRSSEKKSLSPELHILIASVKHVYSLIYERADRADSVQYTGHSSQKNKETSYHQRDESSTTSSNAAHPSRSEPQRGKPLNYVVDRLLHLAAHHKLRPVLLAYDKEYAILPPEARKQLEVQCVQIVTKNLRMVRLYHKIAEAMDSVGIPVLPLKGNLFLSRYYQNQQIREIGDLDILIPPENLIQAMEVLRNIEVVPEFGSNYNSSDLQKEYLSKRVQSRSQCEAKFRFQDIHVDVHWELTHPHYMVGLSQEDLFSEATLDDFFGKDLLMPSPAHTFWMLVAHHGGKENWTRLRHILDFALALEYQKTIELSRIVNSCHDNSQNVNYQMGANDLKLDQVFVDGCKLMQILTQNDNANTLSDVFSARHSAILVSFWESKHGLRSITAIFNRQILRFLRKSSSTSSFAFMMGYLRSILSNRRLNK